jgi:hypothetical protein
MKLKLLFWSAVLLAVIGRIRPKASFLFFATHLMMIATGLCMIRRDRRPRRRGGKSPCRQDLICLIRVKAA